MIHHKDHVHDNMVEYEECLERERSTSRWAMALLIVIGLLVIAGDVAWNQWVYGDWRCAWAHCRKVEVVK